MKLALFFLLITAPLFDQEVPNKRVPLLREGTKIYEATGKLTRLSNIHPLSITIDRDGGEISNQLVLMPNERLAEMESASAKNKNNTFQFSGEVFSYGSQNYLLVRSVVALGKLAERNLPSVVPIDPNAEEVTEDDFDDSVDDIFKELEEATGSLVSSIRNASENPLEPNANFKEGSHVNSRRCHLTRNKSGGWVAVFVSDTSGLSDPPCTILPSTKFKSLTRWAGKQDPSTPVLLSGEMLNYHGHLFLSLHDWRRVHKTDHLP